MTRSRRAVALAATALALFLVPACGSTADTSQTTPAPQSSPSPSPPPAPATGVSARPAGVPTSTPDQPSPTRLVVPAASLDVAVTPVGVAPDGQMQLPPDPSVIGWYRFGPTPGDAQGAVVLGGHLDSKQYGAGPLVGLRRLHGGDRIAVRSSDGKTTTTTQYRVTKVQDIAKKTLPIDQIFDRDGPSVLRIITCGGPYDPDRGYQDNLVVTATPN